MASIFKAARKYMASRLFWMAVLGSMGVQQVWTGWEQKDPGSVVSGCGFLIFAVLGFLQPLVLGKPTGSVLATLADARLATAEVRLAVGAAGFTCWIIGAALKWLFVF